MSEEPTTVQIFLVYEPEKGSAAGFQVVANDADEAAQLYCDIEECTSPIVTVRCVNQDTHEWADVKLYRMPFAADETEKWSVN